VASRPTAGRLVCDLSDQLSVD